MARCASPSLLSWPPSPSSSHLLRLVDLSASLVAASLLSCQGHPPLPSRLRHLPRHLPRHRPRLPPRPLRCPPRLPPCALRRRLRSAGLRATRVTRLLPAPLLGARRCWLALRGLVRSNRGPIFKFVVVLVFFFAAPAVLRGDAAAALLRGVCGMFVGVDC